MNIRPDDLVLEIGSGDNPKPRSDVLCDKIPEDDTQRGGRIVLDRPFVAADGQYLPFADKSFDICLCILSLNFFSDAETVFREIKRVMKSGGIFICSVPVPERNKLESKIRGRLYSEQELKSICENNDLRYESIAAENGVLLYFRAVLQ